MLTLTENATEIVNQLTRFPLLEENGGIRLCRQQGGSGFEVAFAFEPASTDHVAECDGARVFIAPDVSELVEGKTLDAVERDGNVTFTIIDAGTAS